MKTQKFVIMDYTNNTGKEFISFDSDENTELKENALVFDSFDEAHSYVLKNNWEAWATIRHFDNV